MTRDQWRKLVYLTHGNHVDIDTCDGHSIATDARDGECVGEYFADDFFSVQGTEHVDLG